MVTRIGPPTVLKATFVWGRIIQEVQTQHIQKWVYFEPSNQIEDVNLKKGCFIRYSL